MTATVRAAQAMGGRTDGGVCDQGRQLRYRRRLRPA
jgi:hypothetical protein